jgi:hypothetical protein
MGVSGQRHAPAALHPKDPPVPIGQEAGWASEPVWTLWLEEILFASAGDRTPVVQSVVRHYIDWVNLAPLPWNKINQLIFVMVKFGVLFEVLIEFFKCYLDKFSNF